MPAKTQYSWDCQKCGESIGMFQAPTTLVGGYIVTLCAECRNAWHLFIIEHPALAARDASERRVQMLYMQTAGDAIDRTDEVEEQARMQQELTATLFAIGKEWIEAE